jgi:hypothetical protein
MMNRYTGGRMDAQEMDRFKEMLRVDEELRTMYETDRAIQQVLMKDSASIPATHASLESAVMKTLATIGAAPAVSPVSGGLGAGSFLGSAVVKTVITIVAGLGIFTGVAWYVATQWSEPTPAHAPERQQLQTAPSSDIAPPAQPPVSVTPAASPNQRVSESTPARAEEHASGAERHDRTADEIFNKRPTPTTPGATVITPDSVHVKLKLDVNKTRKDN